MLSKPSQPGENLGKVCENSQACENPRLHLGFSLICSRILHLGLHLAMKAQRQFFNFLITIYSERS